MPVGTIECGLAGSESIGKSGIIFHSPALLNIGQSTGKGNINNIQLPQNNIRRVLIERHRQCQLNQSIRSGPFTHRVIVNRISRQVLIDVNDRRVSLVKGEHRLTDVLRHMHKVVVVNIHLNISDVIVKVLLVWVWVADVVD